MTVFRAVVVKTKEHTKKDEKTKHFPTVVLVYHTKHFQSALSAIRVIGLVRSSFFYPYDTEKYCTAKREERFEFQTPYRDGVMRVGLTAVLVLTFVVLELAGSTATPQLPTQLVDRTNHECVPPTQCLVPRRSAGLLGTRQPQTSGQH